MATVVIYNNDVQGALRALKKEQQKEGVFRIVRAEKNFKNNHTLKKERMDEIIRRKIKDKHEAIANSAYSGVTVENPKPFVFRILNYIAKVYDDGRVFICSLKNKKIAEFMLDKIDFDDIENAIKNKLEENKK